MYASKFLLISVLKLFQTNNHSFMFIIINAFNTFKFEMVPTYIKF